MHGLSFRHSTYLSNLNVVFYFPPSFYCLNLHTFQNKDEVYRYIQCIVNTDIYSIYNVHFPHAGFDMYTPGCTCMLAVSSHMDPDPYFNF